MSPERVSLQIPHIRRDLRNSHDWLIAVVVLLHSLHRRLTYSPTEALLAPATLDRLLHDARPPRRLGAILLRQHGGPPVLTAGGARLHLILAASREPDVIAFPTGTSTSVLELRRVDPSAAEGGVFRQLRGHPIPPFSVQVGSMDAYRVLHGEKQYQYGPDWRLDVPSP